MQSCRNDFKVVKYFTKVDAANRFKNRWMCSSSKGLFAADCKNLEIFDNWGATWDQTAKTKGEVEASFTRESWSLPWDVGPVDAWNLFTPVFMLKGDAWTLVGRPPSWDTSVEDSANCKLAGIDTPKSGSGIPVWLVQAHSKLWGRTATASDWKQLGKGLPSRGGTAGVRWGGSPMDAEDTWSSDGLCWLKHDGNGSGVDFAEGCKISQLESESQSINRSTQNRKLHRMKGPKKVHRIEVGDSPQQSQIYIPWKIRNSLPKLDASLKSAKTSEYLSEMFWRSRSKISNAEVPKLERGSPVQ